MSELNEVFEETMRDSDVVTVPIDDTLSNSGEAADAAAVGAALALKADASAVTAISVNGETADAQGKILIDGGVIPVGGGDAETLDEAVAGLKARTAADIPMSSGAGAQTIADAVNAVSGQTAQTIPMQTGGTETIGSRLETVGAEVSDHETEITELQARTGNTIPAYEGGPSILEAIGERVKTVNNKGADAAGNVQVNNVPFADNLTSSSSETSAEAFTLRTTGGNSSVNTGDAWLQKIMGNSVHTGYSPASVGMTVDGDSISATIDEEDFLAAAESDSGTMVFSYTSAWDTNPSGYGITVTGTPANGDSITVIYAKEVRGTITVAAPQRFIATGWNLYDHTKGYAKVKKYSDVYRYGIAGAYTAIRYSAEPGGNQTAVSVINGQFDIIADGYIYVIGGDATTTKIWPTWSDWQAQANGGVFEAYSETEIDISDVMELYFPNGLLKAGTVQDELNLSTGKAINRVERVEYNTENIAAAKASGRNYEYDENWIYIALQSETETSVEIANAYSANDHGLEYFVGTEVDVPAWTMYGQNLKNKLERDTLTMSQQTLTTSQKTQARANIDAASASVVGAFSTKLEAATRTLQSGTNTHLTSVVLNKGVYIIQAVATFSANGSGVRTIYFSQTQAGSLLSRFVISTNNATSASSGTRTMLNAAVEISSDNTTLYLVGYQSSGSELSVIGIGIQTIRLK